MSKKCEVPGCDHIYQGENKENSDCIFFSFPKVEKNDQSSKKSLEKWVQNIGNRNLVNMNFHELAIAHRVCSCHFRSDQFQNIAGRISLKPQAVPTELLPASPLPRKLMTNFGEQKHIIQIETTRVILPFIGPLTEEESKLLEPASIDKLIENGYRFKLVRGIKVGKRPARNIRATENHNYTSINSSRAKKSKKSSPLGLDTRSYPTTASAEYPSTEAIASVGTPNSSSELIENNKEKENSNVFYDINDDFGKLVAEKLDMMPKPYSLKAKVEISNLFNRVLGMTADRNFHW